MTDGTTTDVAPPIPGGLDLLTVAEVATLLRCSHKTIYRRVAAGALPAIAEGGRFLFDKADIRALVLARLVRIKSVSSKAPLCATQGDSSGLATGSIGLTEYLQEI